jgi:hypothetical protein
MTTTALRALAVLAALAMILFWGWILTGGPKKANPDRLDDRAYVTWAKARCTTLREDLATLPNAVTAKTAAARADTLDRANAMVSTFIDDLTAKAPTTGDDGVRLRGWLGDWRTYEGDRERYADELRVDPKAQMVVSEHPKFRNGVDETIRVFADVNDMRECRTPGDVG